MPLVASRLNTPARPREVSAILKTQDGRRRLRGHTVLKGSRPEREVLAPKAGTRGVPPQGRDAWGIEGLSDRMEREPPQQSGVALAPVRVPGGEREQAGALCSSAPAPWDWKA